MDRGAWWAAVYGVYVYVYVYGVTQSQTQLKRLSSSNSSSSNPLMEKGKRLMEASWWERLSGKLSLVLMGRAMLSKSLIQFSVDGLCSLPVV